jgi:hypothetical protein
LVFPLVSSVGLAVSFDLKDENNDGMISRNEWQKPVTDADVYGNWDSNADSYIDENEFNDLDWD